MTIFSAWRILNADQRSAFVAAFLGWALDAFDFFILVFVIKSVAAYFHTDKTHIALALTLTLACRPIGALIFGIAADRFGRRIPLMIDIILYSVLEFATGFAPTLTAFLIIRALFGIGMGGEWGLGASLALETAPAECRGPLSGLLQVGYSAGYLIAAVVFGLAFPYVGWRGLFIIGALPALLTIFIRAKVKESPVWQEQSKAEKAPGAFAPPMNALIARNFGLFAYMVLLMTAFNFMSHGTQDIYPTFLQAQHHFNVRTVSTIAIVYNIGAILGGIYFGSLSEKIGRRRAIITAALIALPVIPLWAFAHGAIALAAGAFLMQVLVQGAWGVIPAHLSEMAPAALRGTFIGFAYQCGNLIASVNGQLETGLGEHTFNGNFGLALALVVAVGLVGVAGITAIGKEKRGIDLSAQDVS